MLLKRFFLSQELIAKILDSRVKTIFLLGASDTGKTTFVECLIDLLKDNFSLGIVDSDMGQSHIGLPTTIAWAKIREDFFSWQDLKVEDFFFVGAFSPAANTQRVLEAVESIFKKASSGSGKVIIDTTGYVQGVEAIKFKIKKIKIINPELVIALKRKDELEPILKEIKKDCLQIFEMGIPSEVKQKTSAQRASFRENLFEEYFSMSSEFLFNQSILKRWDNSEEGLLNKLVCLCNSNNDYIALGVIKKEGEGNIRILAPLKKIDEVSSVIVSNCKWQNQ